MSASTQDFIKQLDLSGQTDIAGTDINQMFDTGQPYTDKGLTIVTTDTGTTPDVPAADVTIKWQRYLWVRRQTSSVTVYAWNPAAGSVAIYLRWQAITVASIADGSVTNAKLYGGITSDKISSVDAATITGFPSWYSGNALVGSNVAGGDLTGTYPNPTVGLLKIDATKIANNTITAGQIANDAIVTAAILNNNVTGAKIADNTIAAAKMLVDTFFFVPAATVTGTADAIVLTTTQTPALTSGIRYSFIAEGPNTVTNPTINWNGLGAIQLYSSDGSLIPVGGIQAGDLIDFVIIDATHFRWVNDPNRGYSSALTNLKLANGQTTFAHGLGVVPKRFAIHLVCKAADLGYSAGDEVPIYCTRANVGGTSDTTISADATNINLAQAETGQNFWIHHKTTGAATVLSATVNTQWNMRAYAWSH